MISRLLPLVVLIASTAFGAEPAVTFRWEHQFRDGTGNGRVFVLEGDQLSTDHYRWGPALPRFRRPGERPPKVVTLDAQQLKELRQSIAQVETLDDVLLPSRHEHRVVTEVSLTVGTAKTVVQASSENGRNNGPGGLDLEPDPSDKQANQAKAVKAWAAMNALHKLFRGLSDTHSFPGKGAP